MRGQWESCCLDSRWRLGWLDRVENATNQRLVRRHEVRRPSGAGTDPRIDHPGSSPPNDRLPRRRAEDRLDGGRRSGRQPLVSAREAVAPETAAYSGFAELCRRPGGCPEPPRRWAEAGRRSRTAPSATPSSEESDSRPRSTPCGAHPPGAAAAGLQAARRRVWGYVPGWARRPAGGLRVPRVPAGANGWVRRCAAPRRWRDVQTCYSCLSIGAYLIWFDHIRHRFLLHAIDVLVLILSVLSGLRGRAARRGAHLIRGLAPRLI